MKISCVLPIYNTDYQLSDTLNSLLNQDYDNKEIIVIDDGSTDEITPLKNYYLKEGVAWITMKNRSGAAFCRNYGNANSNGDVVAVCDAGDFYLPKRLSKIAQFFKESKKDIFYSDVQVNSPVNKPLYVQQATVWDGSSKPPISHPTVAYSREVANTLRYHEKSLDTDLYEFFMLDAYRHGYKFGFLNETLCLKLALESAPDVRDIKKAKELKTEMYKKYKIEVLQA